MVDEPYILLRNATDEQIERELQRRRFLARRRDAAVWRCPTCGATFTGGQKGGAWADHGQLWCDVCNPRTRRIDLRGDLTVKRAVPMERVS